MTVQLAEAARSKSGYSPFANFFKDKPKEAEKEDSSPSGSDA